MRRLIAAALLTLIVVEYSQTGFAQETFTGHKWRTFPINLKMTLIRGFYGGFLVGNSIGHLNGFTQTYAWFALICKNERNEDCINSKNLPLEKVMNEMEKENLDKFKPFDRSTEHAVKEIDSFYEAFPLCRGQIVDITLGKLFSMWHGIASSDESSYNKIRSACGEQK